MSNANATAAEAEETLVRRQTAISAGLTMADDPERIDGLIYPIPDCRSMVAIEQDYDTSLITGRMVRCASCAKHQPHFRGFVVILDDDTRALVGIDCGEKRFGTGEWDRHSAELRQKQEQVYLERRVMPALRQLGTVYPMLLEWEREVQSWAITANLAEAIPLLWRSLVQAAVHFDGRLQLEGETYGCIPHPESLLGSSDHIRAAARLVYDARHSLQNKNDEKSRALAFASIQQARKEVERAEAIHQGWQRNASADWWPDVERWVNASGKAEMTVRGRGIWFWSGGRQHVFTLPKPTVPEPLYPQIVAEWPR